MKNAVILTSILSLISALALLYVGAKDLPIGIVWFYVGLAIFCIIAAITYTVGKKAYGYHGLGDLMVFIFFGLVSVLGVYSLFAKSFIYENILLACCVGLLSAAVLNLNNMRDFSNDANSGKNTLVVKMGPNSAKFYHAILIFLAILCLAGFIVQFENPILFVVMTPCILLFIHLRKVMMTKEPKDFDPELKKVALTTFLLSIVLFITLIFLKP
jgi:1,4-dihydroxy-2-naphthoate octaprenyltransferase